MISNIKKYLLILCALPTALLAGCGGLPAETGAKTAVVVFAAFDSTDTDAPRIDAVAEVVVAGIRGFFDGPSGDDLTIRGIPFGSAEPPVQPFTVSAPGYRTESKLLELRRDSATYVDLTMTKVDLTMTGTVGGSITATTGEPIANAMVSCSWVQGGTRRVVQGYTANDGRYKIGGISAGSVTIEVVATGYIPLERDIALFADAYSPNPDQNFSLLSGATTVTVRGIVTDVRDDTPLANATVTIADQPAALTSIDGRFSVPGVHVGIQTVKVSREDYDNLELTVEITPGMEDLNLGMSPLSDRPPDVPYTIGGHVDLVGAASDAGAVVSAFDLDRGREAGSYTTKDDGLYYLFVPAGRYEITVQYGAQSISRELVYTGGGRILSGIDFALTVSF